jgi:hypothetical protein
MTLAFSQVLYSQCSSSDSDVSAQLSNLGALVRSSTVLQTAAALLPTAGGTSFSGSASLRAAGNLPVFWGGSVSVEYAAVVPARDGGLVKVFMPSPRPEFIGPTPDEGAVLLTAQDCDFEIQASGPRPGYPAAAISSTLRKASWGQRQQAVSMKGDLEIQASGPSAPHGGERRPRPG